VVPTSGPSDVRGKRCLDGYLTLSGRSATFFGEHTFVYLRRRRSAHRTAAGDLGLPGRLRRPAWLPADGAGDRGRRRARVSLDGARTPGQSRAGRIAQTRPDQTSRARALRPGAPRAAEGRAGARLAASR